MTAICLDCTDETENQVEYRKLGPSLRFHFGEVVGSELNVLAHEAQRPNPGESASSNASPSCNEEPLIIEEVFLTFTRNVLFIHVLLGSHN